MRSSDIDIVVRNEKAACVNPWTSRIFMDCLSSGYECWVLSNRQEIATHGIMSVAIGECHLLTLCVHPNHQRQGYGRRMLLLLLRQAARLEAEKCFLEVRASNEAAIALYHSLGFTRIGRRKNYYPASAEQAGNAVPTPREDALMMSRSLPIP